MMTWTANGSGGGAGTIAGTMPRSSMFSFLMAGGKLFALEPSATRSHSQPSHRQPLGIKQSDLHKDAGLIPVNMLGGNLAVFDADDPWAARVFRSNVRRQCRKRAALFLSKLQPSRMARLLNNSTMRSARSSILSLFGSNAATANGRPLACPGNFTTDIAIPSILLRMLAGGRINHKQKALIWMWPACNTGNN